ncbi:MAG TPA: hypothetical protein VM120_09665 [Bryobacteraceae bacterium]|nr:hypothetical protein [Bryobacteraceae bacterium]
MQPKTRAYLNGVVQHYLNSDARMAGVLGQLQNDAPWILAIHIYCKRIRVHGWDWFNQQWTPSDACITANQNTQSYTEFTRCIAGVTSQFERQPGMSSYTLQVNPRRTLSTQIVLWNRNQYTRPRGNALLRRVERALRRREYPDPPTETSAALFEAWFVALDDPEVTNAAPGLTDHGIMQAADFVIHRRTGATVAGTDTAAASIDLWEGRNASYPVSFAAALNTAVRAFNRSEPEARFSSQHLQSPYEPWHYEYLRAVIDHTMGACRDEVQASAETTE